MSSAYSFENVVATLSGPGGVIDIGSDAGSADEGIHVTMAGSKNTMTTGAGGDVMHNLHASKAGQLTVTMLKTAAVNKQLSTMYNLQTNSSGALHGQNSIVLRDILRGDVVACQQVAFQKFPDNSYGVDGGTMQWVFDCGKIEELLGSGAPAI